MAISIIVEDGTSKADANSYVSVADVRTYAANRGVVLSTEDDDVAVMLIKSTDYLEAQECAFQGDPTTTTQALAWPRTGVFFNFDELAPTVIPKQLIAAQCQLVLAINEGFDLQPNVSPMDYVKKETVGPITTEYADPVSVGIMPTFTAVAALLAPLCGSCAATRFPLTTLRV